MILITLLKYFPSLKFLISILQLFVLALLDELRNTDPIGCRVRNISILNGKN